MRFGAIHKGSGLQKKPAFRFPWRFVEEGWRDAEAGTGRIAIFATVEILQNEF